MDCLPCPGNSDGRLAQGKILPAKKTIWVGSGHRTMRSQVSGRPSGRVGDSGTAGTVTPKSRLDRIGYATPIPGRKATGTPTENHLALVTLPEAAWPWWSIAMVQLTTTPFQVRLWSFGTRKPDWMAGRFMNCLGGRSHGIAKYHGHASGNGLLKSWIPCMNGKPWDIGRLQV